MKKGKLWQIYLDYRCANDVPKHTDDPVDVESIVETVDDKLIVEGADVVKCQEVDPQVALLDGSNETLDSVGESLEPLPDCAHDYVSENEVPSSHVAEKKSVHLLCHNEVTEPEPPNDDVVDLTLFKFTHQASNRCPPQRKTDPKESCLNI